MEQAEVLARLRKEKGLSQAEVAEELGVTRQAVSRWESGRAWPSAEKLVAVSRLYGVTVEELCRDVIAEKPEADKGTVEQIPESSNATVQEGKEDPCRRKRWSRFCAVIVVISIYIFIYIWGGLTNSQHTATDNLVFLTIILAVAGVLYGGYRIIYYLKKG